MRVLFSCLAGSGHFHPLVPTARALQQAGHEVAFALPAESQAAAEAIGFRVFPMGLGFQQMIVQALGMSLDQMQARQAMLMNMDPTARLEMTAGMFIDGFARQRLPDLLAVCEQWKPELLVRESMEYAAVLVGDALGIPHASIQVGGMLMDTLDPAFFSRRLAQLRESSGLPADGEPPRLHPALHLSFMPRSYFAQPMPPTTRFLRADVFDKSGTEELPEWVSSLGARPVVYATLGTAFNRFSNYLGMIADGLQGEDLELIITVGRDMDPAGLGPRPANVHVERYIPQSLLLPRCALAILHGGYSSVMSALYAGVPSIILPIGADQPINGEASARIGMSRVVRPDTLTPELIRQQVREMLADGTYRERVQRLRAEVMTLPGVEQGVALLERLARDKALPVEA